MRPLALIATIALKLGAQGTLIPVHELQPKTVLSFEGHVPGFGDDLFLPGGKLIRCDGDHLMEWDLKTGKSIISTLPWLENYQRSEMLCGDATSSYNSHQPVVSEMSPDGSRLHYSRPFSDLPGTMHTIDIRTGKTLDDQAVFGDLFSSHRVLNMKRKPGRAPIFSISLLDHPSSPEWQFSIPEDRIGQEAPPMARMAFQLGVRALAFSPDGNRVAVRWRETGLNPNEQVLAKRYPVTADWLFMWADSKNSPLWSIRIDSSDGTFHSMTPTFTPNGNLLLHYPDRTELRAAEDGHLLASGPQIAPPDGWLNQGKCFFTTHEDTLQIWNTSTLSLRQTVKLSRPPASLRIGEIRYDAVSPNGYDIAATMTGLPLLGPDGPEDEKILIYDLAAALEP